MFNIPRSSWHFSNLATDERYSCCLEDVCDLSPVLRINFLRRSLYILCVEDVQPGIQMLPKYQGGWNFRAKKTWLQGGWRWSSRRKTASECYKIQEQHLPTVRQKLFPEAVALLYAPLPGSPCQQEAELRDLWLPCSCHYWGTVWCHLIYSPPSLSIPRGSSSRTQSTP